MFTKLIMTCCLLKTSYHHRTIQNQNIFKIENNKFENKNYTKIKNDAAMIPKKDIPRHNPIWDSRKAGW